MKTPAPKTTKLPLLVLSLACLGLAGWAWNLNRQVGALQAENDDLRPKLEKAERRAKTEAAEVASLRASAKMAATTADNGVPANGPAGSPSDSTAAADAHKRNINADEVAALVKNPAMRNMIAAQQAPVIALTYKDLMDRLQLSPAERDYLQKLLLERQMVQVNLGMQIMNPNTSPAERRALGQQIQQGVETADANIRDFLNSDADYAYYQTYTQQESAHLEVGMFEGALSGDDTLDPATADNLAGVIANAQNNFPFTVNFYDHRNFGNPAVLNSGAVNKFLDEQTQLQGQIADQAANLLTPAQLDAFKQNQGAIRQMTKMQLNSIVQMAGGGQ
jgi:hypothetical protein